MKRRVWVAALVLAAALSLAGCDSRESCEARGGEWLPHTVLMPTLVGKVTVFIPQTIYECTIHTNGGGDQ